MENLYDLCCEYIENSHTLEGIRTANEKIYDYCCEYINSTIQTPKHIENFLRNHFAKYLN